MNKFKKIFLINHYLGFKWIWFRISYAIKKITGSLQRKTPIQSWEKIDFSDSIQDDKYFNLKKSFLSPICDVNAKDLTGFGDKNVLIAEELLKGNFLFFSKLTIPLTWPPHWHQHPINQNEYKRIHWSKINDFSAGDIKLVWELGRFSFAYILVRAYKKTNDLRFAEAFWEIFESWCDQNPPNEGVHWKCGQEISFRVMACCFALINFFNCPATTPQRVLKFTKMMWASGQRIAANINYALSQKNNHGISEAVGLWTIGVLFPEFKQSTKWRSVGLKHAENQAFQLIYADGAFSQHSLNYHRLMLHDYLWMVVLAEKLDIHLKRDFIIQIRKGFEFLLSLQDVSGRVPNYGSNDGSLILPLNDCDYLDYRPVLQALHYYFYRSHYFDLGSWNEDLIWLFGHSALNAKIEPSVHCSERRFDSGYYTFRTPNSFAFIRACQYKHRPAEADQLHFDLWWQGINIAIDPGTYSYNAQMPWHEGLSKTSLHNAVTVDNHDQMDKVSKFLWLPWCKSKIIHHHQTDNLTYWESSHNGFKRLKSPVNYRRAIVRVGKEYWVVFDSLQSHGEHAYQLNLQLADTEYEWDEKKNAIVLKFQDKIFQAQINSTVPFSCDLIRACHQSAKGWQSLYYYHKSPALSISAKTQSSAVLFWTVFGPEIVSAELRDSKIELISPTFVAIFQLNNPTNSIITSVQVEGEYQEGLTI